MMRPPASVLTALLCTLLQVLSLMKEVTEEEEAARSSDSNGYHSDSDNTVSAELV